ncbi:MAG: transcriptional regulator PpsR [Pseudomonadota bacterium]
MVQVPAGVICDVAFGSEERARNFPPSDHLVGRAWIDTVTAGSRATIGQLLRDSTQRGAPLWRRLSHLGASGTDLPVEYTTVRAGTSGRVVAIGRSLRPMVQLQQRLLEAQVALEREHAGLRKFETRYRLLFQEASGAALLVDAANHKVVESNINAAQFLVGDDQSLAGRVLGELFDAASRHKVEAMLRRVLASGEPDQLQARRKGRGKGNARVAAWRVREGRDAFFLVRLEARPGPDPRSPRARAPVGEFLEHGPDGFVITDSGGRTQYANLAFVDMVELGSREQARNEPLDRWLGSPGVDFQLLTNPLRAGHALRLFATTLRSESGSAVDVEICGVRLPEDEGGCYGFAIRDIGRRLPVERRPADANLRSLEQLTELVGRVALKELVRESTGLIERRCIEAALKLTGDNRAAAASVLGLSRQSLYAKMRQYGIYEPGLPN